jgi:hypothetical protein
LAEDSGKSRNVEYEIDAISPIWRIQGRGRQKRSGRCRKLEKHKRAWSSRGKRGEEVAGEANHLRPQFLIGNQKDQIKNMARRDGAMFDRSP